MGRGRAARSEARQPFRRRSRGLLSVAVNRERSGSAIMTLPMQPRCGYRAGVRAPFAEETLDSSRYRHGAENRVGEELSRLCVQTRDLEVEVADDAAHHPVADL